VFATFRDSPTDLARVEAKGEGRIHSMTTVRVAAAPGMAPPYVGAIVELDEAPRLLGNIEGGASVIGGRERGSLPPLPVFTSVVGRP
jgi:uncharacterized OB-fold protein